MLTPTQWRTLLGSLLSTPFAELSSFEVSNPARAALIPVSLRFKWLEMVHRRVQSAEAEIKATLIYPNSWIFKLGSACPSLGSLHALEVTSPPGWAKEGCLHRALSHNRRVIFLDSYKDYLIKQEEKLPLCLLEI